MEGVDYAWDRPSVAGLVAAGKRFVVRYGGPGSDGKQIWADEVKALTAAGIAIVANAEGTASGFRTYSAGQSWARDALAHFEALGMPDGRPIYFSADWDVQASELDDVDAALRGAASVVGAARVGLYGGRRVIAHAMEAGTARWFWQTYAWSRGVWVPGAHLQQYRNGVSLAGGTVDLNRSMKADFGQWGAGTPEREDTPMTPAELATALGTPAVRTALLAALQSDALDTHLRGTPWRYVGGGIPSGYSTLKVANETLAAAKTAAAKTEAMAALITADADEDTRAVMAAIDARHEATMAALTAMEGREVERDKEQVAALLAALPTGTDPVSREELTAALRDVYGQAFTDVATDTTPAQ